MNKYIALTLTLTVLFVSFIHYTPKTIASYDYVLTPDFPENEKVPVNIEKVLTATVTFSNGTITNSSIVVYVKLAWETTSTPYYSEPNTGKVKFKVNAPSSFNRQPQSVTFTSQYFATVVTYIIAVPAVIPKVTSSLKQYVDPIEGKDITILASATESEKGSIITTPSSWATPSVHFQQSGYTVTFTPPQAISTGVYAITFDVSPNPTTQITIDITLQVYYSDYYSIPATFTVNLAPPIIVVQYVFETGESAIVTPENSGVGIEVSLGCPYFDMTFLDYQGRPVTVNVASPDFEVLVTSSTSTFNKNYGLVVTQLENNKVRVQIPLVETWYIIHPKITTFIGSYPVSSESNELKVGTVRSGFNIWDFITTPYILIPIFLVIVFLIFGRKRKKEE